MINISSFILNNITFNIQIGDVIDLRPIMLHSEDGVNYNCSVESIYSASEDALITDSAGSQWRIELKALRILKRIQTRKILNKRIGDGPC